MPITGRITWNLIWPQDIAAARVVFGSGVPLVQVPCMGVASTFRVSGPELKYYLKGKNPLCDYLAEVTQTQALQDGGNTTWSRPIWDVTAVAWLTGDNFEKDHLVSSPIPEYDHRYAFDPTRHLINVFMRSTGIFCWRIW